jgi:hypothetical protein
VQALLHILSLILLISPALVRAEVSLQESRVWLRARTIADGQQVFSLQAGQQDLTQRFGADGRLQPLGRPYDRSLTWKQLLQTDAANQEVVRDYMRQNHINENDTAATASYDVKRSDLSFTGAWAYGLTKHWMIGFQVPVTQHRTHVNTDVTLMPMLSQGPQRVATHRSLLALSPKDLHARLSALANQQLSENGYDGVPADKTNWAFGDISLLSQIQLTESYHWAWSLQQLVRLPTARNPNLSDYVQTNSDEGQTDVGLTSLLDYRARRMVSGFRIGYVAQLPDSVRMHDPAQPKDIDPSVHRDLGDYGWAALDTEFRVTRRLGLNAEYSYLKKAQDHYSGQSTDGGSYASLGEGSNEELHQTRVGMLYRLGDSSTRSGVENKWVASIAYTYPWIGRNASEASQASLELISYF